jgi:hypothetical protein
LGALGVRHYALLANAAQGHTAIQHAWGVIKPWLIAGHRFELEVKPETRTTAQNSRMWAMLAEVSRQVNWHGQKLSAEDWKHVFTASLKKQRVAPGLDGGFVVLGQSTSKMTKADFSELMELIAAFGAQQGVEFAETAQA